jgi:hypothetical protein
MLVVVAEVGVVFCVVVELLMYLILVVGCIVQFFYKNLYSYHVPAVYRGIAVYQCEY